MNQGEVATYTIDLNGMGGYSGSATFSATAFPALDAEISFSPLEVPAGGSTVMSVTPSTEVAPGIYTITVTAQDGELTKTTDVRLKVWPEGTISFSYENGQGGSIPDKSSIGTSSTINVPDDIAIVATSVAVDISHTRPGDLVVSLTSPNGKTAVLHDREFAWAGNYDLDQFELDRALGDWTLKVTDELGKQVGVLNGWSVDISGAASSGYNYLPSIDVNGPAHGSPFLVGDMINFSAVATDVEDGDVSGSINWSSDIDGPLGSGGAISTSSLSYGNHEITVTAVDAAGQESSKRFNISVLTPNTSVTHSMDSPVIMPETHGSLGYAIVSEIDVPEALIIDSFSVSVNISFDWIGDLKVDLIAPSGKVFKLHDMTGYSNKDLVETFTPADFIGDNSFGVWKLRAEDMSSYTNNGVLNSWSITLGNGDVVTPPPGNTAPTVSISSPTGGSTVTEGDVVVFSATADDSEDGDVSASINWLSSLDGLIGTGTSVSTTTLSAGEHTVMAEAVDSQGASGSSVVTVTVTPAPANEAPTADFGYAVSDMAVSFTDMSGDSDGSVVAWAWDFGDGNSSDLANPSHTYAGPGSYPVTLTVTDNDGATHSVGKSVTVTSAISLDASATHSNGRVQADLSWAGAKSRKVDIYRDGVLVKSTNNDGHFSDSFRSNSTSFTYKVCLAASSTCSAEVTVQATAKGKEKKSK
ncbi:proprotein convertase P-domain-containing protein [Microbulbifer taiwanensis]|uniref:proprotein convertase P-domain-containing protein n=1 Tax=Microbulbifer taiwanensis TaxID=986746 RepID=UPI00360FE747